MRQHAAGALARSDGGAGSGVGSPKKAARSGRRKGLKGGGAIRRKSGRARAQSGGIVKQVRIGGRPMQMHAMEIPADSGDMYGSIPGGGDREAAEAIAEAGVVAMRGDYEEAERLCKAVLARFPDHYIANYNMGMDCRLAGKMRRAVKYLKRAISVWPENHIAHAGLGRVLLDMKRYGEALDALDRALELRPGNRLALEDRDEALEAMRRGG